MQFPVVYIAIFLVSSLLFQEVIDFTCHEIFNKFDNDWYLFSEQKNNVVAIEYFVWFENCNLKGLIKLIKLN